MTISLFDCEKERVARQGFSKSFWMPFSVSAQSFVPLSHQTAAPLGGEWTVAAGELPASGAAAASMQLTPYGTRRVVCSAYFQNGVCSDGDFCSFAHNIDELDVEARIQLLSVLGDAVPAHFMNSALSSASHGTKTPPDYLRPRATPPGSGSRGNFSNSGVGAANRRPTWRDGDCPPQLSISDEPIRVHLPARCRYPHAVSGTYYDYLNISRTTTQEGIEDAYRQWRSTGYRSAKAIDLTRADAVDRLVVDAKNVLGNPTMRAEYDAQLPSVNSTPVSTPVSTPKKLSAPASISNVAPPLSATMFEDLWR